MKKRRSRSYQNEGGNNRTPPSPLNAGEGCDKKKIVNKRDKNLVGMNKPKNKLEGIQCNLMAENAEAIFNYLYTKNYEQLIPILMSDELSIFYDITLE